MKELQLEKKANEKNVADVRKSKRIITRVKSKAPTASSCEIPILSILFREQINGVRTRQVLEEVRSAKWFGKLNDDDRKARYPESKKKIVDSVIKFAKKNLVIKGHVFPPGNDSPLGTWKITREGSGRFEMDGNSWSPKYSIHNDAVIIEFEKNNGDDEAV